MAQQRRQQQCTSQARHGDEGPQTDDIAQGGKTVIAGDIEPIPCPLTGWHGGARNLLDAVADEASSR